MLAFFGRHAASSKEAHDLITELLANPMHAKAWLIERARRFVAKMEPLYRAPDNPQDSHGCLFKAACVLVHGFALEQHEAYPLLREYANRSDLPWSDYEVQYKVRSATNSTHDKPRGHLIGDEEPAAVDSARRAPASAPALRSSASAPAMAAASAPVYSPRKLALEFDPEKLKTLAAKWRDTVNVEWFGNRSAHEPCTVGPTRFLELLYQPGERVLLFTVYESQGQAIWPVDPVPGTGAKGVWYLAQPVNGQSVPNPRTGRMSRRSQESVTAFRYLVLESDKADMRDWLGLLVQLPLQIEAIYTSGGKSVHALVRVDCRTHREWEEYVKGMMPVLNLLGMAGVDPKTLTSVRLTRLPGALRAGRMQKLLFLRPGAGAERICDLPAVRDGAAYWLVQYARVIDGYEEASRELRRALWYYGPANAACRTALKEIEAEGEAAGALVR